MADRSLRMDEECRSGGQEDAAASRSLRPDIARNHDVAAPNRMTHVPKVAASNTFTQPVIHRMYLHGGNFTQTAGGVLMGGWGGSVR